MLTKFVSAAAVLCMTISPIMAAEFPDDGELGARRSGVTAGAYFRLPLTAGGRQRPAPQFGLRLSSIHDYRNAHAPTAPVHRSDAFELRLSGRTGPRFLLAGQPVQRPAGTRMNLGSTETIAIVGGGVLVLLLVAAAAGGGGFPDTCPTVGGSRDHCINP